MTAAAKVLLVLVVAVAALPGRAWAQSGDTPVPTGFVNDYARVVDPASAQRMETMARNFREKTNVDVAVVTLQSLQGRPIEDVALGLGRGWGIGAGQEKEGILILLAIEDRRSRVEVSRHLEDEMPDITAGRILRNSRADFGAGQYGQGLSRALETVLATIADQRGISIEGIDQAKAFRGEPDQAPTSGFRISPTFIFILIFILIALVRGGGGGGGYRRRRRGGIFPVPIFFPGGWGSSGGGGGGGGWDSGGGGGDWGGFGGGGDFGGGGASDSW